MEPNERKCAVCDTIYVSTDQRKIYCSGACKQEAHRRRHDIPPPGFLVPDAVKKEKARPVVKLVNNPIHVQINTEVRMLESRITSLTTQITENQREQHKVIAKSPEVTAAIQTAAMMLIAVLGTVVLAGFIAKNSDKEWKRKLTLFAAIIGLGAGTYITIASYAPIKSDSQRQKMKRLEDLKLELEKLMADRNGAEAELTVLRQELKRIPSSINQIEQEHYVEVQVPEPGSLNDQLLTVAQLQERHFDLLKIGKPFADIIGQPERGFACAVYGQPGAGKSTFTADLAADLAGLNGIGVYISAEEGFSQSMQRKMAGKGDHLLIANHKTLASITRLLKTQQFDIVALDSIQQMGIKPEQLALLRLTNPRTSFLYILQVRKDGEFRGDNRYAHDADIIIRLEDFVPLVEKSRFLPGRVVPDLVKNLM